MASPLALFAQAKCEVTPGPGKVQCTVREVPVGGELEWGDIIVLAAPPFAPPLRTRVGGGAKPSPEGAEFALALAATGEGKGQLRVLARAVVCGHEDGCRPVSVEASAEVVVGAKP